MPIVTLVNSVHSRNAWSPMEVTLLGMVTLVNAVLWKAPPPMDVTLLPSVTLINSVQVLNASWPIVVTLSGIVMFVNPVQA